MPSKTRALTRSQDKKWYCSFKAWAASEAREGAQFKTKSTFGLHRNSMAFRHQKSRSWTTSHSLVTGEMELSHCLKGKASAHSWLEMNEPKSKGKCCCCLKLHLYIRYSSITYYIIWYYKYRKPYQATYIMLKTRELFPGGNSVILNKAAGSSNGERKDAAGQLDVNTNPGFSYHSLKGRILNGPNMYMWAVRPHNSEIIPDLEFGRFLRRGTKSLTNQRRK